MKHAPANTLPLVRFLTLFSGAGGSDIGIGAAGCESVGIEYDEHAAATARAAGHSVIHGDVRDLSIYPEEPFDALWSSFPCQDWSSAGKREGSSGERNGWPWTVAALDHVKPRWFVGENVTGLVQHRGSCKDGCVGLDYMDGDTPRPCPRFYFDRVILAQLRDRFAWVGWRVLDAADYGVPQFRRRVFLIAGPRAVDWPKATHGDPRQPRMFERLQDWGSMRGALGDLSPEGSGPFERWRLDRPSPTVLSSEVKGSGRGASPHKMQRASDALYLATGRCRLTIDECAALQGFPDGHPWRGTKAAQYRQAGNAVPPKLAEVVVRAVLRGAGAPQAVG